MSFALTPAAADALSKVLLSTHTVEDGLPHMPDPSQYETTSVIDPASLTPPPVPLQYVGSNQFVSPSNTLVLSQQPPPRKHFEQSQFVSAGVASTLNPQPLPPGGSEGSRGVFEDEGWCGTPPHFPPPPPGPWAEVVVSALAFR